MTILYLSYNGAMEEILPSQTLPHLKRLSAEGRKVILLTFEKPHHLSDRPRRNAMADELRQAGIRWVALRYHRWPRFVSTFWDLGWGSVVASWLVWRHRVDWVHARGVTPASLFLVAGVFGRPRFLFDTRGLLAEEYVGGGHWQEGSFFFRLVKRVESRLIRLADHIVTLTDRHRFQWVDEGRVRADRIRTIPCCVDLERFLPPSAEAAGREKYILYLGKLSGWYQSDPMIDLWNVWARRDPELRWVILTQEPLEPIRRRLISRGVDLSRVRLHQPSWEEIPRWVAQAWGGLFFIEPRLKHGSSPIKLGEFLASGVPVIINPGIGDSDTLVRRRKVGIVVERYGDEDYERAYEAFTALRREPDIIGRCRRTAEETLSLDWAVGEYRKIYDSAIRSPQSAIKSRNLKVLFIVPYPTEGASNRVRVEQFLPYIERRGIRYRIRPFIGSHFYRILYRPGSVGAKVLYFLWATLRRLVDMFRVPFYDVVFVHREAFPIGIGIWEWLVKIMGKPIVFDFDDAIYLTHTSPRNNFMERFKRPAKVPQILALSRTVLAGNGHLAYFASAFNRRVAVFPTCVDTDVYKPAKKGDSSGKITIGWVGSTTTQPFLKILAPAWEKLSLRYPHLELVWVGQDTQPGPLAGPRVRFVPWSMENERAALDQFDIGVMPMPDNEWTRGKCGFKALLYMSMGIPVVCSPVGANLHIVRPDENGFLAATDSQWEDTLSRLIEDPALRRRLGQAGRQWVEARYSVRAWGERFCDYLEEACAERSRSTAGRPRDVQWFQPDAGREAVNSKQALNAVRRTPYAERRTHDEGSRSIS